MLWLKRSLKPDIASLRLPAIPDIWRTLRIGTAKQSGITPLDVTDPVAAQAAVQLAIDAFGGLDVVVNNAGYGNVNSIEDTALEDSAGRSRTKILGTIIVTKAAIPIMREQRSGHIIQFSSVGGRVGAPGRAPCSAAKWAVEGFSGVPGARDGAHRREGYSHRTRRKRARILRVRPPSWRKGVPSTTEWWPDGAQAERISRTSTRRSTSGGAGDPGNCFHGKASAAPASRQRCAKNPDPDGSSAAGRAGTLA